MLDLLGGRRRVTAKLKKIHAVFDEQIDRRLTATKEGEGRTHDDFLDSLLHGFKLDRPTMKALFTMRSSQLR